MFSLLYSEQEILREEISSLQAVKTKLQARITQLEEELKKEKDSEKKDQTEKQEEEVSTRTLLCAAHFVFDKELNYIILVIWQR